MHFSEEGWLHLSFKFALNQTKRSCVKYRSCCEDTSQAWTVADFWKEEGEVTSNFTVHSHGQESAAFKSESLLAEYSWAVSAKMEDFR